MKKTISILAIIVLFLAICYGIFCALVYYLPELFFYHPDNTRANIETAKADNADIKEVTYKSADGTELYGWYARPTAKNYTVVFMHGNSGNIGHFYKKMKPFADAGYGIFLAEYRGFGGIKGKINQENLEQDALAAIKYLKSLGYENDNLIIYGMSLGSHMAVSSVYEEQKENPFKALILEVPFDSLYNVVKNRVQFPLPLKYLIRDKYDNVEKIKGIKSPLLINVAGEDKTVSPTLAKALYREANEPRMLIEYPRGEHNNLYDFKNYETILNWLE